MAAITRLRVEGQGASAGELESLFRSTVGTFQDALAPEVASLSKHLTEKGMNEECVIEMDKNGRGDYRWKGRFVLHVAIVDTGSVKEQLEAMGATCTCADDSNKSCSICAE